MSFLRFSEERKNSGEIAAQHNLNPNMVRNWKREFLEKASSVFEDPRKESREAKKKADAQQKETAMEKEQEEYDRPIS